MDSYSGNRSRLHATMVAIGEAFEESERSLFASRFDKVVMLRDASSAPGLIESERPELAVAGADVHPDIVSGILRSVAAGTVRCPVVALTRGTDRDRDRRLKGEGAIELLSGPVTESAMKRLSALLTAVREQQLAAERFLCPHCPSSVPIVGHSAGMVRAMEMLKTVSESPCNPILILGETGTGKELAARAVHVWRCGDPEKFVAVNCATLNANLLESELFGHVKGSFTGADREKSGLLEVADCGTIFLDEISEMPLELQAKLLRFLQERSFRKVGGTADIPSHATVVASSNVSLYEQSLAGGFRRDLYYRLAVFPIELPPLRAPERRDDILLLAEYFTQVSKMVRRGAVTGLSDEVRQQLLAHTWPGNVRELQNVIERALILEKTSLITPGSVAIDGQAPRAPQPAAAPGSEFSLETAEKEFICRALQVAGWHRTRAADMLGITRATLHAKIKRYDIRMPLSQAASGPSGAVAQ
jgi:transcriptional regulator with PAS, ATPase and Fis domain